MARIECVRALRPGSTAHKAYELVKKDFYFGKGAMHFRPEDKASTQGTQAIFKLRRALDVTFPIMLNVHVHNLRRADGGNFHHRADQPYFIFQMGRVVLLLCRAYIFQMDHTG